MTERRTFVEFADLTRSMTDIQRRTHWMRVEDKPYLTDFILGGNYLCGRGVDEDYVDFEMTIRSYYVNGSHMDIKAYLGFPEDWWHRIVGDVDASDVAKQIMKHLARTEISAGDVIYLTASADYALVSGPKEIANFTHDTFEVMQRDATIRHSALRIYAESDINDQSTAIRLRATQQSAYAIAMVKNKSHQFLATHKERAYTLREKTKNFNEYMQFVFRKSKPLGNRNEEFESTLVTKAVRGEPVFLYLTPFVGVMFKSLTKKPVVIYDLNTRNLTECRANAKAVGLSDLFKVYDLRTKETLTTLLKAASEGKSAVKQSK